jgi:hypothetical protein
MVLINPRSSFIMVRLQESSAFKIIVALLLTILLSAFSGPIVAQIAPPKEGIAPETILKPTNPITGRVDHSTPQLKIIPPDP